MKITDIIYQITIGGGKESHKMKVYFGERDSRLPMIGRFVYLKDGMELQSKGMVRFVSLSKLDFWAANPNVGLTKIYVVKDFSQVKLVN